MSAVRVSLLVLAGGTSKRLGEDKALLEIAGEPMIARVINRASTVTDEVIVVTRSPDRIPALSQAIGPTPRLLLDERPEDGPLIGLATGLKHAAGELAVVLACDLPLVAESVLHALLQRCSPDVEAVIPRWPNGFIEPLHAVYRKKPCLKAACKAVGEGSHRMTAMIEKLHGVFWQPTEDLRSTDPQLLTFMNVNTQEDFERIKRLL